MMRSFAVLLSFLVYGSLGLFSVHDDLLAFPQYEIAFRDGYVTEAEAASHLEQQARSSAAPSESDPLEAGGGFEPAETHEQLWLAKRRYLCKIPMVKPPPPMNSAEKELSKVKEEKELARATDRGWELLSDLEGKCLYFVSGWWSYSFCHNREVRQFHHLPPQQNNQWPPTEDPDTQSYVLGRVLPENFDSKGEKGAGTELQAAGDLRYLVQKLGGGTTCDLTGKNRKIEVQFHCNSHGVDRIGWIKEVSICCYLMVVYTPRLCNDVAFLPPRENRANAVSCKLVMNPDQVSAYYKSRAKAEQAEALKLLELAAQKVLGGKKVVPVAGDGGKLKDSEGKVEDAPEDEAPAEAVEQEDATYVYQEL